MKTALAAWIVLLGCALAAQAEEHAPNVGEHAIQDNHAAPDTIPHPINSRDTTWAGAMVIVIVGLFVAAAAVGVVVRANTPDEPPQADAHHDDEAHGSHHGHH